MSKRISYKLDCAGQLLDLSTPAVMGILNVTPDSFYDGGSFVNADQQLAKVEQMVAEGASIIDIGAVSTRPGAGIVDESEEILRLTPVISRIRKRFPDVIISVDTFRTEVARISIDEGAGMINDIYAGRFDGAMFNLVIGRQIPYVMMHMQGTPETMQLRPTYDDVLEEELIFFDALLKNFKGGIPIIHPGFGFGKTIAHNFSILSSLERFT